jgi:S-adenosylmethionine hydrolase
MARPVIALLTDFGSSDGYVGVMKGVMLGGCPDATFVDLSHEIPPHDIASGSWLLETTFRYFPAGTVFLVVVDPGVGTARRGVAVEAAGYRFVGPDNGVLTPALDADPAPAVVDLQAVAHRLASVSRTFEGRDRFAPAAASLASGVALDRLGPRVERPTRLERPTCVVTDERVEGAIVAIDRFGNVMTDVAPESVTRLLQDGRVVVRLGDRDQQVRLVSTYAEATGDEVALLVSSSGHLELATGRGRAVDRLEGATPGTRVRFVRIGAVH